MSLGRQGERQSELLLSWDELPRSQGHPFYDKLQERAGPGCLDSAPRKLSGLLPGLCERGALRFSRRGGRA